MVMEQQVDLVVPDEVLRGGGVRPVFQPIVALATGRTVGYEALARWPDHPGLTPAAVFAEAAAQASVAALDTACRTAALQAAMTASLGTGTWLFVNTEPATLAALGESGAEGPVLARAGQELSLVLELTERALLLHPRELLHYVARVRAAGWRIAVDDVGAHPDSLALLDVLMPAVIKLDLSLVQRNPGPDQARLLSAVMAHCERTDAVLLAEGIENDGHREQAIACGAALGQGFALGVPAPLPVHDRPAAVAPGVELADPGIQRPIPGVPFDLVAENPGLRTAPKNLLTAFSHHLERLAENESDPPIVLAALQHRDQLTDAVRERYRRLARRSPLVALFGAGVPDHLGGDVRGADLHPNDPLIREWVVVVLGAQTAAALIARDRGEDVPAEDRRFDFLITYDRCLVSQAARSMMTRLS